MTRNHSQNYLATAPAGFEQNAGQMEQDQYVEQVGSSLVNFPSQSLFVVLIFIFAIFSVLVF